MPNVTLPWFLSVSGVSFPFGDLGCFGGVVGSLAWLLRQPSNVSEALGGPPVLPEALLEEQGSGCGD